MMKLGFSFGHAFGEASLRVCVRVYFEWGLPKLGPLLGAPTG